MENMTKIPTLIKNNPVAAAIISKLVADKSAMRGVTPQNSGIQAIAISVNEKIKTSDDILQLFPDTELCVQILLSSILSPNELISSKLNYVAPEFSIPISIRETLIQEIENYIETTYKINDKLYTILKESLFTKGAYIEAIIPESSLDDVISQYDPSNKKVTVESYVSSNAKFSFGFLGKDNYDSLNYISSTKKHTLSGESYDVNMAKRKPNENYKEFKITAEDLNIEITDNFRLLNLTNSVIKHMEKQASDKVRHTTLSQEDNNSLDRWFRAGTAKQFKDYIEIKDRAHASRESLTAPLILKLPTQATIPVHVVHSPEKHLGYFVVLNEQGVPITETNVMPTADTEYYDFMSINNDNKLNLIDKAKIAMFGMTKKDPILNNIESVYSSLIEEMIKNKLKTGLFADIATINSNYDIYRIMFQRSMKNQQTKLLFLPADLVAYYAFDYRDNGTGKSLIEKSTILYSIRAILLLSRIMASLKNSTTITEVTTEIDEKDPNPDATMEKVKSDILRVRQSTLPLGITNVNDLQEWVTMGGFRLKFKHPSLPTTDITTSDLSTSKVLPDDELDRNIRENIIMSFGLTPEIVEAGYSTDFATTVTAKNLLLAKRATQMQNIFVPQVSNHIRKLLRNDPIIYDKLKTIVKNNIVNIKKFVTKNKSESEQERLDKIGKEKLIEYILEKFINEVEVTLPRPEVNEANNLKNAFEDSKANIELVADSMFDASAYPAELVGNISNELETIKAIFKIDMLKTWIVNNNFVPEFNQFLTKDDDGNPTFNFFSNHMLFADTINQAYVPILKSRAKLVGKLNEKLDKAKSAVADTGSTDYSSDSGDSYDSSEGSEGGDDSAPDAGDEAPDMEEAPTDDAGGDEAPDADFDMEEVPGEGDTKSSDNIEDISEDDMNNVVSNKETEKDKELKDAKIETEKARAEKIKVELKLKLKELYAEDELDGIGSNSDTGESGSDVDTSDSSTNSNPTNDTPDQPY